MIFPEKMLLWVPQYSAYNVDGQFVLEVDSNWQLVVTKLPYMLKENFNLHVNVIVPKNCLTSPAELLIDAIGDNWTDHISLIEIDVARNAARTRYDFNYDEWNKALHLSTFKDYTHVYANDPMLVRHLKAIFTLNKKYPKFIVQTHFLDTPSQPLVEKDLSYWHGTVEGCIKSDIVMWHCQSMCDQFNEAATQDYASHICDNIASKSMIWKSGYSSTEIRKTVNLDKLRFQVSKIKNNSPFRDKKIVWVPNRIGGLGKSFDYTNAGKFLFEIVPKLWQKRQDFVVIAGNPNQKISNDEIRERCPAYVKLVDGPLNREEYRFLSRQADIVAALYTIDTNGGLAALESIEMGAVPLFPDIYEYKHYFDKVNWPQELRVAPDLSDTDVVLDRLLSEVPFDPPFASNFCLKTKELREYVRNYSSYEETTKRAMQSMDLL